MKTIALANQKGGVAKTTSVINIGAGIKQLGQKVILIDLDPQAHLTYSLGIQAHQLGGTVYELLKGEARVKDVVINRNGIGVIPSSLNLAGAEMEFAGIAGREFLLKDATKGVREFDYLFIDCPPSLGLLTLNALTTVKEVYIPLQTEFLALQGMAKLLETIEIVRKRLNPGLKLSGVIGTMYDGRKRLNREVVEKVKDSFEDALFKTLIRSNVSVAEAPSFGKTIFEYKAKSYGAEDYLSLSKEILERGQ